MTTLEASQNIGKPFKVAEFNSGLLGSFDTIISVDGDGNIYGDFIIAHCQDCRLKQEQPKQLNKQN
jgi:hypothetical protein